MKYVVKHEAFSEPEPQIEIAEQVAEATPVKGTSRRIPKMTVGYIGVWLFLFLYFIRPGDFYEPLLSLPLTKITGIIPAIALVVAFLTGTFRLRIESKLLLLLFADLCICIPFSGWRGGSFDLVIFQFSKVILISIVVIMVTNTFTRLRRLLLLQTAAVVLLSIMALIAFNGKDRMFGEGHAFSDPNDLALNVCIVVPFCLAFLLSTRNIVIKIFWLGIVGMLSYVILVTLSRGGFLAMVAVFLMIMYQFGFKGRRAPVLLVGVVGVLMLFAVMAPSGYGSRIGTIFTPNEDPTNSAQARTDLLRISLITTAKHPLFGAGPGQFQLLANWFQTHNTYTQFSAEAGIPALLIFLLLIRATLKNLKAVQQSHAIDSKEWIFAAALKCSFTGYLVGAFFLSTGYWFYPYLLIGYIAILQEITKNSVQPPRVLAATPEPTPQIEAAAFPWETN